MFHKGRPVMSMDYEFMLNFCNYRPLKLVGNVCLGTETHISGRVNIGWARINY